MAKIFMISDVLVPPIQTLICQIIVFATHLQLLYGKCPKISNNKVTGKMTFANSADPDQTAP